jgi:hypothetical protein
VKKLPQGTAHHLDAESGNRRLGRTTKYTSGNAASDLRHNHIASGPAPGERSGHARGDGPKAGDTMDRQYRRGGRR